jgi:glycosyltransferase involved in cell wall biosynthesis
MQLGLDARELSGGLRTGIGRSLANFIRYFGDNDTRHRLVLFAEDALPLTLPENIELVRVQSAPTQYWDQVLLPGALKTSGIDLFYSPYYKIPLAARIPVVSQIFDLMFLEFPFYKQSLTLRQKAYYTLFGRLCAARSISIITDSQHAKHAIMRIWKIRPQKISVIQPGLAKRFQPVTDRSRLEKVQQKFGLPDKYILYLGNFKPHKNVDTLIEAFALIADQFKDHFLVLAGHLENHIAQLKAKLTAHDLKRRVVLTGPIDESDCPEAVLTLAEIFVFPSLYEGFGLPPLEAMACGTPVVASKATSLPEVLGDAGLLVDAADPHELARAMALLLQDAGLRKSQSLKGFSRAANFREEHTTAKLYQHILQLLENPRS